MYLTGSYLLHNETMNLRDKPGTSGNIVGEIPINTTIEVSEVWDNWGKTVFGDKKGWCCISEHFAKYLCGCGNETCEYFKLYRIEKERADKAEETVSRIKKMLE